MIKTAAIVLHRYSYSDSSWIVRVLTQSNGLLSFILKGGKQEKSAFKGVLDPLSLCEIVYRDRPNAELLFVKEATLISWHSHVRENLESLACALVMAEMVMKYAPAGIPLENEFMLLREALAQMDEANPSNTIFSKWLHAACDLWGYQLDLETCTTCGAPMTGPAADFHPESGGVICHNCLGTKEPRARQSTLEDFWNLAKGNELCNKTGVENALISYLRNHIGYLKELNSLSWLQEVRKLCYPQNK
ncbi:MAG: DNA repair protein RecO [Fibrobacteraceae bacterium]|nr:DNA repair protein RecO [Fibrobacteraceae bacterium]